MWLNSNLGIDFYLVKELCNILYNMDYEIHWKEQLMLIIFLNYVAPPTQASTDGLKKGKVSL